MTTWNAFQDSIFAFADKGEKHGKIVARAGTGKSTTILEAASRLQGRGSILLVAFANQNAKELSEKIREAGIKGCEARTYHSLGNSALIAENGFTPIDNSKMFKTVKDMPSRQRSQIFPFYGKLKKLISFARNSLATDFNSMVALSEDHFLYYPKERGPADMAGMASELLVLLDARSDTIDFDEQIYVPAVNNMASRVYDFIFIDEAQDTNPCQIKLILNHTNENSRVFIVGDDRQAIYSWRGASQDAMDKIAQALGGVSSFSLPMTYRCPKRVVALAQTIVPDYEANEENCEGTIEEKSLADPTFEVGSFIISRTNAGLIEVLPSVMKEGKPFKLLGKDIGANIADMMKKSKTETVSDFLSFLNFERTRWIEVLQEDDEEKLNKKLDELGLIENLFKILGFTGSLSSVEEKLAVLFVDEPETGRITLGTVHKMKGKEAKTVYILKNTFRADSEEEKNLFYVAITRTQERLVFLL